ENSRYRAQTRGDHRTRSRHAAAVAARIPGAQSVLFFGRAEGRDHRRPGGPPRGPRAIAARRGSTPADGRDGAPLRRAGEPRAEGRSPGAHAIRLAAIAARPAAELW